MRRALVLGLSAVLLVTALACIPADAGSEAVASPMSVSLFDLQGHSVSGNLLDETSIPISTHTDVNTGIITYTIVANTPLMGDTRYLVINPSEAGDCVLTITAVRESGFITESGITFAFYEDTTYSAQSYVGEVSFTAGASEEQDLNRLLTAGKAYYIRAWTTVDYPVTDISPSSHYEVDLIFTATTGDGVNAVFYHMNDGVTDGPIASALVTNGMTYGDPPVVERAGYHLLGWFTDPALGEAVHPNDTVDLDGPLHLYAHWAKLGTDTYHEEANGNDVWIYVTVTEDSTHVTIDGKSESTRVVTKYSEDVVDGKVIVDTRNTAVDFTKQDAKDANDQYSVIKDVLTSKGIIVDNYIVLGKEDTVSCEEGSLGELLNTDCNDFRTLGSELSISMDRGVIATLKDLTGDTVIKAVRAPQGKLTEEQKDRIGEFPSYEITIVNNGVEINELSGTITAWFAYDAPNGTAGMHVYLVSSDGSTKELPFTYDNGIVTFRTSHLSIYYVSQDNEQGGEGPNLLLPIIIASVIAAAVLVTALAVKSKKKKRRCEQ